MKTLVIDIGGTHVKFLLTGEKNHREFVSGPTLTPRRMIAGVKKLTKDWRYEAISIGFPGPVLNGRPVNEPYNLGRGWVCFDFAAAFKRPVKVINDAALQALGSYRRGKLLFLGLGTGLGSAMVVNGLVEPMELGHLPYKKATYEDYVGLRGLTKRGKKKWRRDVADIVKLLTAALEPDDVVLGGGNAKKLKKLPKGCRAGDNANAFVGGFRLWAKAGSTRKPARARVRPATKQTRKSPTPSATTRPRRSSAPPPRSIPRQLPEPIAKAKTPAHRTPSLFPVSRQPAASPSQPAPMPVTPETSDATNIVSSN